jgi:hypothetical protein
MRLNRTFLGWGVFLVLAGAVPLAVRAGLVTTDQVRQVGSFWPVILIGIGVGVLLSQTRAAFLGGLIVAATFGIIVGGVLSGGIAGIGGGACGSSRGTQAINPMTGNFTGTAADVGIDVTCAEISGTAAPGSGWRIEGQDDDGLGPLVDSSGTSLAIRSPDRDRGPFSFTGPRPAWDITLPDAVRLDVSLSLSAGAAKLDLTPAQVEALEVELNAGSATIELGEQLERIDLDAGVNAGSLNLILPSRSVRGSIEVNAGAANVCVPAGVGLRFDTSGSVISGFDFDDQGLVQDGSVWSTPGFATSAVQIDLETQVNAGSLSLNPEDGCDG